MVIINFYLKDNDPYYDYDFYSDGNGGGGSGNDQSMIDGWHKRCAATLAEHHMQLERFNKIQQVEKTKQFLLIKNYLQAEEAEKNNSPPKSAKVVPA